MTLFHPPDSGTCHRHPLHRLPCAFCSVGPQADDVAQSVSSVVAEEQPADPPAPSVLQAAALSRTASEEVIAHVSELREGEENDGPLQSTDLFVTGRGISLLVNVAAGQEFTYSLGVDGQHKQAETVGASSPSCLRSPLVTPKEKTEEK